MFDLKKVVYMEGDFEKEFFYYDSRINLGCFKSKIEGDHPLDTLKAIQRLKDIFEKNNKKDKVNLTKSMIDNQMCVKNNEDHLDEMDKIEIRTKALELACNLARTPRYDGDIPIVEVAKHFYTYIIKGE